MTIGHACPLCDTGRAHYYVCRSCKQTLDQELGVGWEKAEWFKEIIRQHNRLLRAEYRERELIARLNDGDTMEPPKTVYDRAVALIRSGILTEGELVKQLSVSKRRVNTSHIRKVVTRALEDTRDELHLIGATAADEWSVLVEA